MRRFRYLIFLKDVLLLACTAFGGPQVHLMMMIDLLVVKRRYLTEAELLELQALCQVLPGPTSTQTVTALGFKIGGPSLAYLTVLVWSLPAMVLMTMAAIGIYLLEEKEISLNFARFLGPMAVAFLIHGGFKIAGKVIHDFQGWGLLIISAAVTYLYPSPYMTPVVIVLGGVVASLNFKQQPKMDKERLRINWSNFLLWLAVLIAAAVVGAVTKSLPVRLFENFYRNGSLVFGGGQVLIPILFNEFVNFKHYLTQEEFLTGMALTQVVPGPVFSISTYVGAMSMQHLGISGLILGGLVATVGIFLPGTFFIFFAYRFWDQLKKYRGVRASLQGVHATSVGLMLSAAATLFVPMVVSWPPLITLMATLVVLTFTKIPSYLIILGGLLLGFIL
ncbi:chromate efflux transporter [Arundinibacter roseus]|uniref:Chromate efflux transporter n=1 Tax=Arundinibacter roseus TaxID=2070510 RepID=A0A4R4KN87_9BACT|nr:chromate efflux transporter [Arundinibacter roseus]TDB68011.1 chromate efflux transporter [Arundinibacter roseus]